MKAHSGYNMFIVYFTNIPFFWVLVSIIFVYLHTRFSIYWLPHKIGHKFLFRT